MAQQRGMKRAGNVLKRKQKKEKLQKAVTLHRLEHGQEKAHDHEHDHDHEHEHKEEKGTDKKSK